MTTVLERPIAFDSVLATVAAIDDLSPHLRRVTFVAPRIAEAVTAGPDQRIKVLLSPPDGSGLRLPSGPEWYAEWCAMPVEERDPCGIYFGPTGGQVYGSADSGDHWAPIVRDLPPVLSVEVQTLP